SGKKSDWRLTLALGSGAAVPDWRSDDVLSAGGRDRPSPLWLTEFLVQQQKSSVRIQKPLNGLNDRARSSNRICGFLDRGELFACKFNFKDSLESQAVILLARADGAGEFCDATTRATGDQ